MNRLATSAMACLAVCLAASGQESPGAPHSGTFEVSRLTCVIGDNTAEDMHRAGYNGVFRMTAPESPESAYVPSVAGLNLEHYFDGRPRHPETAVFFEPRHAPMTFRRIDATTAELHQPPTPHFGVESWTTFALKEPYYVDMAFRCVPTKAAFDGGYMGVFWASYINAPLDKSIYFLGEGASLEDPRWVQLCTQQHARESTVLPEDDSALAYPPESDTLFHAISPLRYSAPFYYGRIRDMVLIYIFEPNPYLRFAHSPSGGGRTPTGDDTNPAWDFQLVIPDWRVGASYTLNMRAVYKPWADRGDVLEEVRKYLEGLREE